jgi:hypothetical protein
VARKGSLETFHQEGDGVFAFRPAGDHRSPIEMFFFTTSPSTWKLAPAFSAGKVVVFLYGKSEL